MVKARYLNLPRWQKVRINIIGLNQTRLLNYLLSNDIEFFDLVQDSSSDMYITINKADYKRVCLILDRLLYVYSVTTIEWLHSLVLAAIRRIGAILGVVVFTAILIFSNAFVWSIRVEGLSNIPSNFIHNILEDTHVRAGILAGSVPRQEIKQQIMSLDGVVDVTINMSGTTLVIAVFEDFLSGGNSGSGSIISKYDATIDKIIVSEGTATVQKGDVVKVGDELISPIIYGTNGEILKTTIPKGEIYGTVVFGKSQYFANFTTTLVMTGRKSTYNTLSFLGLNIGKIRQPDYKLYTREYSDGMVADKSFLPIRYTTTTYYEQIEHAEQYDIYEHKDDIIRQMQDMLVLKANGSVVETKYDIRPVLGGYRIDVFIDAYMRLN